MTIPKNFGISKISMLHGEQNRYQGQERSSSSKGGVSSSLQQEGLSFELNSANNAVALVQSPSFNVLYVATPKIALLQTPQFRAVADLWQETVELVKPLLRFGFPETSLKTKCPYYDDKLYATSSGALLASDRTRTLLHGIQEGYFSHPPHSQHNHGSNSSSSSSAPAQEAEGDTSSSSSNSSQRQPSTQVGMFGISTLAFLASQVAGGMQQQKQKQRQQEQQQRAAVVGMYPEQHPEIVIPKSKLLVPDIPSGTFVLALNLLSYWALSGQSRRSSMGGSMTG